MKYFYNIEKGEYENTETIRKDYFELFADEYEDFWTYLEACMTYNNGALQELPARARELRKDIRNIANTSEDGENDDDVTALQKELDYVLQLMKGGNEHVKQ